MHSLFRCPQIFSSSLFIPVWYIYYSVLPEACVVFRKEPLVLPVLHVMQNPFLFHFEVCLVLPELEPIWRRVL